jgi:hypothetical protein
MSTLTVGGTPFPDSKNYARSLRTIGQDLANLFPENLEIEVVGNTYVARCQGRNPNSFEANKGLKISPLKKMLRSLGARNSGADPVLTKAPTVPVARTYTPADIDRIYGLQIFGRSRRGGTPDLHSLAERLRTIGRIVHSKPGQLLKIFSHKDSIGFQYCDSKGEVRTEELSHLTLHRLQQDYFSQRETNQDKDVWEEADR